MSALRSAPKADAAHGLAGGNALSWRKVGLAAGADAHLVHSLLPEGLAGGRGVEAKREVFQSNAVGIKENLEEKNVRSTGSQTNL